MGGSQRIGSRFFTDISVHTTGKRLNTLPRGQRLHSHVIEANRSSEVEEGGQGSRTLVCRLVSLGSGYGVSDPAMEASLVRMREAYLSPGLRVGSDCGCWSELNCDFDAHVTF